MMMMNFRRRGRGGVKSSMLVFLHAAWEVDGLSIELQTDSDDNLDSMVMIPEQTQYQMQRAIAHKAKEAEAHHTRVEKAATGVATLNVALEDKVAGKKRALPDDAGDAGTNTGLAVKTCTKDKPCDCCTKQDAETVVPRSNARPTRPLCASSSKKVAVEACSSAESDDGDKSGAEELVTAPPAKRRRQSREVMTAVAHQEKEREQGRGLAMRGIQWVMQRIRNIQMKHQELCAQSQVEKELSEVIGYLTHLYETVEASGM